MEQDAGTAGPVFLWSLSIQNGDKTLGKDPLTSDDSAVTDLSPKTDSSPITETPTKTDASFKTDAGPSTPAGSPQPKKGCCSISKPQRQPHLITITGVGCVAAEHQLPLFWSDFPQDGSN
ncbi:hypothetical protein EYF80_032443 [Liparis tanakae]|uniref:Uncharacterized protein n=1 Tax=Liparis tanakae TaxID=230148 RepID=A0A4Z2GUS0_9TELE|nr:hypothetical protein EYF80_032443 [Liparis tanakae]